MERRGERRRREEGERRGERREREGRAGRE
jgi:hypothetical protein